MNKVLIIDNYDSFTWNLYQYFREIGVFVIVKRNDDINVLEIKRFSPNFLVISPGPGCPDDAGISLEVIRNFFGKIPIFGVCLGHQVIAQFFGAKIISAKMVMHGKSSLIFHDGKGIFFGLKQYIRVIRYHSLIVDPKTIPTCLEITAWSINNRKEFNEIMGIRHRSLAIEGVQFHPESILSQYGKQLLANFININMQV